MGKINREDMLELTRRMTLKRNCFDRIAGAYMDEEGFVAGTSSFSASCSCVKSFAFRKVNSFSEKSISFSSLF